MTLILNCLTADCVYQVSDRRLTSFHPPRALIDDESNKAIFVNGRVVFGYTGISHVNGEKTDIWFTRVAASAQSADLGAVSRKVRDEATSSFRRMLFASRYKRHAFQGAGWFTNPESDDLRPGVVTIHNALEPQTFDWLPYAKPQFEIVTQFPTLRRNQLLLTAVGLRPSPAERGAVYQLVRKCVHRKVRRQEAVLSAMVLSMRWLSARYEPNSPIGPNLMAVSLPKAAARRAAETGQFMAIARGPSPDVATFLDVNISGRAVVFGPRSVYGSSTITEFIAGPIVAEPGTA